jgi:hypothetical protein
MSATGLVPGRDLHIIACQRPAAAGDRRRILGVRWASRPDLGFPIRGYVVRRTGASAALGIFWLPDTASWQTFRADALARRPARGPYFPTVEPEDLEYLLPIVRLADPRTPAADLPSLTLLAAAFFGNLHVDDAGLAWRFWPFGTPPGLADLLQDPAASGELVRFYRQRAVSYLLALALRFEYAVLFGLALDDAAPPRAKLGYEVQAAWPEGSCTAKSDAVLTNQPCAPAPPAWVTAERAPGSVAHPAFAAWPGWSPPPGFAPLDGDGDPLPAEALVPRSPAAFTALTWAAPPPGPNLIGHGPVLYRVGRFDHGPATAGSLTPPPLPPGAAFTALVPGEDLLRGSSEPHFLDLPGKAWPPLEGHSVYSVRGLDLLGNVSSTDARAGVRHHDDIAPTGPRVRALDGPIVAVGADGLVTVPLRIDWGAAEDFVSPDVVELRVAVSWTATGSTTLRVTGATPAGALHVDLTIQSIAAAPDALAGARLSMPGAEFPIVSHGTGSPAAMRVRRSGGRTPPVGVDGLVLSAGPPSPRTRVLRVPRRPAVAATVESVDSLAPLEIAFAAEGGATLPQGERVRVYLHLFRASFGAEPLGGARWSIATPGADDPAREIWDRWAASPDAAALLQGSPAILFPPHAAEVRVSPPPGFSAGLLEVTVTAADGAAYVASPAMAVADPALIGLRGNESAPAAIVLSVRTTIAPATAGVTPWNPGARLWATSAAIYAEAAQYDVAWNPVAGAVRYEVWRALDAAIAGAGAAVDDAARRALAATQPQAFELRSGQVFGTVYRDALPGRAPTRAYYRVRAIGANGVAGAMSAVIGPVHVPDVRRPPAPNLFLARATAPPEADRAIALEWTQAGDRSGVRFEVEYRALGASAEFAVAGEVPATTPPAAAGVFRFVHEGRPPGKAFEYRVLAYRRAADPIDPAGAATREIASAPSAVLGASAISIAPLGAPAQLTAVRDPATGAVALAWANTDLYEAISVRRRAAARHVHTVVAKLAGDAAGHVEPAVPVGTWRYQVRAHGVSREARSEEVEVTVP